MPHAWLAVQGLGLLIEPKHESEDNIFSTAALISQTIGISLSELLDPFKWKLSTVTSINFSDLSIYARNMLLDAIFKHS